MVAYLDPGGSDPTLTIGMLLVLATSASALFLCLLMLAFWLYNRIA